MKTKTRNEVILDYFDKFPLIQSTGDNTYVATEWLDENIIFSITDNPSGFGGELSRDVVGNVIKGYDFMFQALFEYTQDTHKMLENTSFFEELEYWVKDNNKKKVLPEFDDERKAIKIDIVQTPFLMGVDPSGKTGIYTMQFRFIYYDK